NFDRLLKLLEPIITKQSTQLREAIPSEIKLAITLRFLATGVSKQFISAMLPDVLKAIIKVLKDYIKGRTLDGGVFKSSSFYKKIEKHELNLPNNEPLPGRTICVHLHNFLRMQTDSTRDYCPPGCFDNEDVSTGEIIPGSWRAITADD
ncbi:Uncharacterized protein OBRU01_12103, partial [Operophtera brumata]